MILEALHSVCTFEEVVTSSRLYGLTSVRKELHLYRGWWHTGACCDLGLVAHSTKCRDLWRHGVVTAQAAGVRIVNYIVLSEHCGRSAVAGRAAGVLSDASGPSS